MKKHHQHYVWRKYLGAWTVDHKIWCYRSGKVFNTNLMNVGQSRDFYKLKKLTNQDIEFLRKFAIEGTTVQSLRELNEGWIETFNLVFKYKEMFENAGMLDPALNKLMDEMINNFEEECHSYIEIRAIPYIDAILKQDVSFYNAEDDCMQFAFFLCTQYMRTNRMQESVCRTFSDFNNVNIQNVWSVSRHIFATNLACTLFTGRDKFKLILVKNESTVPLITADQPAINTYAIDNDTVNDMELYYPVSPKLAILLTAKEKYRTAQEVNITSESALAYNSAMLKYSEEQIYGNSKEILEQTIADRNITRRCP